jgi:hypothetical protein
MTANIRVVVPCRNATRPLPGSLTHIAAQQVRHNFQGSVIDNASTVTTRRLKKSPKDERCHLSPRGLFIYALSICFTVVDSLMDPRTPG